MALLSFACRNCNFKTNSFIRLYKHYEIIHNSIPCLFDRRCSKKFNNKKGFLRHARLKHMHDYNYFRGTSNSKRKMSKSIIQYKNHKVFINSNEFNEERVISKLIDWLDMPCKLTYQYEFKDEDNRLHFIDFKPREYKEDMKLILVTSDKLTTATNAEITNLKSRTLLQVATSSSSEAVILTNDIVTTENNVKKEISYENSTDPELLNISYIDGHGKEMDVKINEDACSLKNGDQNVDQNITFCTPAKNSSYKERKSSSLNTFSSLQFYILPNLQIIPGLRSIFRNERMYFDLSKGEKSKLLTIIQNDLCQKKYGTNNLKVPYERIAHELFCRHPFLAGKNLSEDTHEIAKRTFIKSLVNKLAMSKYREKMQETNLSKNKMKIHKLENGERFGITNYAPELDLNHDELTNSETLNLIEIELKKNKPNYSTLPKKLSVTFPGRRQCILQSGIGLHSIVTKYPNLLIVRLLKLELTFIFGTNKFNNFGTQLQEMQLKMQKILIINKKYQNWIDETLGGSNLHVFNKLQEIRFICDLAAWMKEDPKMLFGNEPSTSGDPFMLYDKSTGNCTLQINEIQIPNISSSDVLIIWAGSFCIFDLKVSKGISKTHSFLMNSIFNCPMSGKKTQQEVKLINMFKESAVPI